MGLAAPDSPEKKIFGHSDPTEIPQIPPLSLQSPWPGTGVLPGKSLEVLREVLPGVLWEIGVLWGVLPRVLRETRGAPGSAPESALPVEPPHWAPSGALPGAPPVSLSTLGSTPQSTPISQSTPGSTSRSTSQGFPR